jgi:pentatricopeptide repeat protein
MYNSVVNAFASLESSQALERVKRILHDMENGEREDIPRPDLVTYNTVIKAMRSGNDEEGASFAESILTTLESFGKRDPKLLPDSYSYTSVINAYARSNSPNKAERSLEIVNRMMKAHENGNKGAGVTIFTLNAALNACAFVDGSVDDNAKAFEVAMTLDALKKQLHLHPDNTWFGTMLRVCSSLLQPSPKREELVDRVFGEACQEGCVGRLVLVQLKFAATAEQYMRLVHRPPSDKIHPRDLPKEWTCNGRDTRPPYKNYSKTNNQL